MKKFSKNSKFMAILLVLSMLTSLAQTGAFSVNAFWDGIEQSADSPVVLYYENPISNDMEVPENAVLTVRYELMIKLPTEQGAEYTLAIPEDLTAIDASYDIYGYAVETDDPADPIETDGPADPDDFIPADPEPSDSEYYIGTMLVNGNTATITFFEQPGGKTLSVCADVYCYINADALTEPDEYGNRRVTLTSGGADVSLVVTGAVEAEIMALDGEWPGEPSFLDVVELKDALSGFYKLSTGNTSATDPSEGYAQLDSEFEYTESLDLRLIYFFDITGDNYTKLYNSLLASGPEQKYIVNFPFPDDEGLTITLANKIEQAMYVNANEQAYKFGTMYITKKSDGTVAESYVSFEGDFWALGSSGIQNGYLYVNCTLDIDIELLESEDGKVTILGKEYTITQPAPPEAEVTKTGSDYDKTTGEITWTITFDPKGNTFTWPLMFTDTFSENQDLVPGSLMVKCGDKPLEESGKDVAGDYINDKDYQVNAIDGNSYAFEIAVNEPDEEEQDENITITYKTKLNAEVFDGSKTARVDATNTVVVSDKAEQIDSGADTVTVFSENENKWIEKNGTRNDSNKEIDWTITVYTHGQDFETLVLHDLLPQYNTMQGSPEVKDADDNPLGNEKYTYSTPAPCTDTTNTDGCSFEIDFKPPYAGKYVITYTTKIDDAAYAEAVDNTLTLYNKAWLTYKWRDGEGPDNNTHKSPDVEKGIDIPNKLLQKEAIADGDGYVSGYNAATHTVAWTITVNPNKLDLRSATITDTLPLGLTPVFITGVAKIDINNNANNAISLTSCIKNIEESYVYTFNVEALGTNTATITIYATVDNPDIWAKNDTTTKFKNIVSTNDAKVDIGVTEPKIVSDSADSTITVNSNVVSKTGAAYNHNEKTIEWTVEINRNKMPMSSVSFTDVLQEGLTFIQDSLCYSTNGVSYSSGGSLVTGTVDNDNTLTVVINDTLFGSDPYNTVYVKFRTLVNVDAFTSLFEQNGIASIKNEVTLNFNDDRVQLSNKPEITVSKPALDKIGTLHVGESKVDYEIRVNPLGLNLLDSAGGNTRVYIEDTLDTLLNLDMNTVRLFDASVGPGGEWTTGAEVNGPTINYFKEDGSGKYVLQVDIPAGKNNAGYAKSYILRYTCIIQKGVSNGTELDNAVKLKGSRVEDNYVITSKITISGAGAGGIAMPANLFAISLTKFDSERSTIRVKGAQFEVYNVDNDVEVIPGTTNEYGVVEFYPLKINTKYKIREVSSAVGYVLGTDTELYDNKDGAVVDKLDSVVIESSDGNMTISYIVYNDRITTDIEFTKISKSSDGSVTYYLSGVQFMLMLLEVNGFTVPAADTDTKTTTSVAGKVKFENIPYGTYRLTETNPLEGFAYAAEYRVEIKADGSYEIWDESELNDFPIYESGTKKWVLENKPETGAKLGKITINKYDSMRPGMTIAGVTFKLEVEDGSEWYYVTQGTTNSSGRLVFDRLPLGQEGVAKYRISEIAPFPEGYSGGAAPQEVELYYTESGSDPSAPPQIEEKLSHSAFFENDPNTVDISFQKVDGKLNPISGVTFELSTDVETNGFTERNDIYVMEATSNDEGMLSFDKIPFGEYELRETSALSGYAQLTTVFTVVVNMDGTYTINGDTAIAFVDGLYEITNLRVFPPVPGDPKGPEDPSEPEDPDDPDDPEDPEIPDDPGDTGDPPEVSPPVATEEPTVTVPPPAPPADLIDFGNTLVPLDDGSFMEFDEDGVPLGKWTYDEVDEVWIFEPIVPTGAIETGDSIHMPVVWITLLCISAGTMLWLLVFKREKRVK